MLGSASGVKTTLLCLAVTAVVGDLPPGTRRNANTYLPPEPTKGGYDYNKPRPTSPVGPPRPPPTFPTSPTRPPSFPGPGPRPGGNFPGPGTRPGGGYPGPGPKPTPGFPDYTGSPSGTNTIGGGGHDNHVHEPGMPYDFNYAVKDDAFGNDYSHQAASDGDIVRGEYRIQLPDGRTQIVKYTASWKDGFSAQVSYEGTPRYDLPNRGGGGGAGGGAFQGY